MFSIQPPGLPFAVSKFIFGTGSLFNTGSQGKRLQLLFAAADAGFTHFDTAPYYGFGLAERDLAGLLKARPDLTVTTKVGLYSPGGENQGDRVVFARKALGRVIKPLSRPGVDFGIARAQAALEGSLRRLGRDHIDLYTLHEPELALVDSDEWPAWLQSCVRQGKVRAFGVALEAQRLAPFLAAASPLAGVIQVDDSLDRRQADIVTQTGRPLQITYGYVTAARARGSALQVPDVLRQALRRNDTGALIVSTTKPARMPQYAELADEVCGAA